MVVFILGESMIQNKIIQFELKYRGYKFIQIVRQTILALFPVILIGSFAWTLSNCILNPSSLLGRLLHLRTWFPQAWFLRAVLGDLFAVTSGLLAFYAVIVSARFTTQKYHHNSLFAEILAAINYLLVFHHNIRGSQNALQMRYYSAYWFIIGVIFGYFVGLIFVKFAKYQTKAKKLGRYDFLNQIRDNMIAIMISVVIAFVLHVIFALFRTYNLDQIAFQQITSFFNSHSNYWLAVGMAMLTTVIVWLGFAGIFDFNNSVFSNEAWVNLNYFLLHKKYHGMPYPYTPTNFFNAFAQIGGLGCTLALIIAVLLITKNQGEQRIVTWSTFPAIFNANMPLALGIPIILNPIMLIPFVFTPIVNMILGSAAISIHLFAPLVFPVPTGTPGILVPLIASGGNWFTIVFMLLLLVIDVLIYYPFIKIAENVEQQINERGAR